MVRIDPTSLAARTGGDMTDAPHPTTATRHIGILLFDDVEELDAVGPWEVLSAWAHFFPQDGWSVSCISADGGTVRCAKGLVIGAHHSLDDAPRLDVLIHPGGIGTRPMLVNAEHLAWVQQQRQTVPLMTSVCSGSLVYAAAGLLSQRPATTHWAAISELAALDASVRIDETARFVDDGDVITSAGVSTGIDMALYLIERLVSADRAREVQRYIQYDHGPYPQP
jgi:transcriptional regulator GlxA family with amidase domain